MHIETISNGMGAPSMYLLVMAAKGEIPAKLSITGDTGSENDMLWSNGRRTTSKVYFDEIIEPFAKDNGLEAVIVRSLDENGNPLIPIVDLLKSGSTAGVPLFGSNGGKLNQACTSKYKIRAVRQELRRRGATTARVALGLTITEVHRIKPADVQWCENYWPLIDVKLYRQDINERLEKMGIPWLITTECDNCPHQNLARWRRRTPETIGKLTEIEGGLEGLYFTKYLIPLNEAIKKMEEEESLNLFNDSCDSGYCFV